VFSYVSPLLTIALAFAGFRMLRLPPAGTAPGPPAAGKHQLT
jgi:hypothetical protein